MLHVVCIILKGFDLLLDSVLGGAKVQCLGTTEDDKKNGETAPYDLLVRDQLEGIIIVHDKESDGQGKQNGPDHSNRWEFFRIVLIHYLQDSKKKQRCSELFWEGCSQRGNKDNVECREDKWRNNHGSAIAGCNNQNL